ncbi:TPM domain-containing protein [Pelomonas sp. SE-A7]|uniref:TPM domain-containing protein n=1 Tax=Pelomonas sp. SE-A7 TaxID=3054953 RepID=UPI00259C7E75|nr:TPM domain-containing protein [Pelomonas sp. SE-A7]MDM4768108.1 TPM domain-containing protein [Pelomonas sp. SE-A7]
MAWFQRLQRLLKHRSLDALDARRALGPAALEALKERIEASERLHSGELRVVVEAGLPLSYLMRDATARERAVNLFGKLRVWDTEHNNGVLIYLLLAEHRIELLADRGLMGEIDGLTWQRLVERMREQFRAGRFEDGLIEAVEAVSELLVEHFPRAAGEANPNELPDEPLLL